MEYMYGALLLHKLGKPINEENMKRVIEATGSQVDEAKIKVLVTSLQGVNIDEQLANATVTTTGVTKEVSKEEKKEEKEKVSEAAEGLSALFG